MENDQGTLVKGLGENGLPGALLPGGEKTGEETRGLKAVVKGGNGTAMVQGQKETPEQFKERKDRERKERLAIKLERASKPETMLVTRNAIDTNDFVFLINALDFQLRGLRDRVGIKEESTVTLDVFKEKLADTEALKNKIHLMCKELSTITTIRYKPPRGFK